MTFRRLMIVSLVSTMLIVRPAFAGEFYKLYPHWLDLGYHILLTLLIIGCLVVSFFIFGNFKGGKLGLPWVLIMIAFIVLIARMIMSILTVFEIQYFQAIAFAGLDILFFILLLIGLILYKVGLE